MNASLPAQVRRWMRNPKVSVEKAQGKGLLYPCPKCPLAEDLWYTHFPSPYGCCHYSGLQGGQYYHQEPCSPCPASGQTSGHDKSKGCKVKGISKIERGVCVCVAINLYLKVFVWTLSCATACTSIMCLLHHTCRELVMLSLYLKDNNSLKVSFSQLGHHLYWLKQHCIRPSELN